MNAFTLCSGLCLSNQPTDSTLAVLDGDVYGTRAERRGRIRAVITGDQPNHIYQRKHLMRLISTLVPKRVGGAQPYSPEQMLHRMLRGIAPGVVPDNLRETYDIAQGVVNVPEKHGFVNQIIELSGESRMLALARITELASLSTEWKRYTRLVRHWLTRQRTELVL